jgi:hypothetical protein
MQEDDGLAPAIYFVMNDSLISRYRGHNISLFRGCAGTLLPDGGTNADIFSFQEKVFILFVVIYVHLR